MSHVPIYLVPLKSEWRIIIIKDVAAKDHKSVASIIEV